MAPRQQPLKSGPHAVPTARQQPISIARRPSVSRLVYHSSACRAWDQDGRLQMPR